MWTEIFFVFLNKIRNKLEKTCDNLRRNGYPEEAEDFRQEANEHIDFIVRLLCQMEETGYDNNADQLHREIDLLLDLFEKDIYMDIRH